MARLSLFDADRLEKPWRNTVKTEPVRARRDEQSNRRGGFALLPAGPAWNLRHHGRGPISQRSITTKNQGPEQPYFQVQNSHLSEQALNIGGTRRSNENGRTILPGRPFHAAFPARSIFKIRRTFYIPILSIHRLSIRTG